MQQDKKKTCPACGGVLMFLPSMNKKKCYDCYKEFDWKLEEKQLPLIKHQR